MQEFFFEDRGIAYRKNEFESQRPTLVFIHGLSGSSSAWFPYEKHFSKNYNLITLDLRGHGKSNKPKKYEDYKLGNSADDVFALLQYLHVAQCVLVSHSYGTLVALEFLQAHKEKVTSVVFVSPTAFLNRTRWFWMTKTFGRFLARFFNTFPFHPIIRERVDYTPYQNTGDWNIQRLFADLRVTTLRIYLYCLTHAYAKNYDPLWKDVRVPTLIIHGTLDSIIPVQHSERLSTEIEGSTLVLLKGANHVIVLNNIAEVSREIDVFVD